MHQCALAKVGLVLNMPFTGCKCAAYAAFEVEAYQSVGSYEPANLVVSQAKRPLFLEDNAAYAFRGGEGGGGRLTVAQVGAKRGMRPATATTNGAAHRGRRHRRHHG